MPNTSPTAWAATQAGDTWRAQAVHRAMALAWCSMSQRSGLFGPAPEAGTAFMELYGTFWRHGQLDQQLKEAVRLRNARLTHCGY